MITRTLYHSEYKHTFVGGKKSVDGRAVKYNIIEITTKLTVALYYCVRNYRL